MSKQAANQTDAILPLSADPILSPTTLKSANSLLQEGYQWLIRWLSDPETYYQLVMAGIAITLGYMLGTFIRRRIPAIREVKGINYTQSRFWFVKRLGRMVPPLLALMCISGAGVLCRKWLGGSDLVNAIERVALVWLLWVGLRAFVSNAVVQALGVWILVPSALLQLFGLFTPVADYLDGLGFTFGNFKITAYLVIKGLLFFSIILWIGKILSQTGENYIRRNKTLTISMRELTIKLFNIILYITLGVVTLDAMGIDLTALTVFSGALGVGLGFGLQKIASNFISGLILLTEQSITLDDLVELDNGVHGFVRKLGARASVIECFDGKEVMVPNEDFITSRVANLTYSNTRARVEIPIGVSYQSDIRLAYNLILDAAKNYPGTAKDPEPNVFLRAFGASSVDFLLVFWVDNVRDGRWRPQSDVMFTIWDAFKEHGIEIPFPQQDIHIRSGLESLSKPRSPTPQQKA